MTYYHQQVLEIRERHFPHPYLITRVIRAKHLIEKHFCDAIDLNLLSHECALSKFHLLRLFKSCYGQTPYQFITEKRISMAKDLLGNGHSASSTCFLLGFSSPASFTIYFKKNTGTTPTEYKKAIINKVG